MNEHDLMSKLAASKAIMDNPKFAKNNTSSNRSLPQTSLQDFDMPQARYNIPQEFLQEQQPVHQPYLSELPRENTKPVGVPTVEAIQKSKLPDQIKKLMIEHPITQPQQTQEVTISSDLIERASRLMKRQDSNYLPESAKKKTEEPKSSTQQSTAIDYKLIQKMINEAVENALTKAGMISESQEKTNEMFSFRVGKHLFEGKITKVKKLS